MSKVFCVIPVHNRLVCLKSCIDYLNVQDYEPLHIVVVDDGSTDGTGEYLASLSQRNLTVLTGDGNLWWGGAMRKGMEYVVTVADPGDYLLMLNDDVKIDSNYVSELVRKSLDCDGAVVGSVQRDQASGKTISWGYSIDYPAMEIVPFGCSSAGAEIDGFPGRGVLYPMVVVHKIGLVNATLFPQYFGDIEYSTRAKDSGYALVVSQGANTYTDAASSDQNVREKGLLARWFHPRSKSNLVHRLLFFSLRGPKLLRVCAVPRFAGLVIYRGLLRSLRRET